jgi:4,5-DOPA dioxygenase extradiol
MSKTKQPALFISHGAPTIALEDTPASAFLRALGTSLPRPQAILTISAHWTTNKPKVSLAAHPETIHDFGGFPQALYEMTYPAPGAPELASRVAALLQRANLACDSSPDRGYDHGVWIPLRLMYPAADIPVAQLSVQPNASAEAHYRVGQALQELRDDGVLILASGTAVHNLYTIGQYTEPPAWAVQFEEWLYTEVLRGTAHDLLRYEDLPTARMAHPTPEHWLPFYVALGAASNQDGQFRGEVLHRSWAFGSLSMAAYSFEEV